MCSSSPGLGLAGRRAALRRRCPELRLVGPALRAFRVNVAGILLAAGAGTRFRAAGGGSKLLAPVDGRPLIERPLEALRGAGLGEIVVVLGSGADEIRARGPTSPAPACWCTPAGRTAWRRRSQPRWRRFRTTARPRSSCSAMARASSARRCAGCARDRARRRGAGRCALRERTCASGRDQARAVGAPTADGRGRRARARRAAGRRRLQRSQRAGRRRYARRAVTP